MIELADMSAYVAVVEAGGFSEASRQLGTTKSALSRRVADLELALGVVLLERRSHGVRTTEVGAVYYAKCVRILESVSSATAFASSFQSVLGGTLRVAIEPDYLSGRIQSVLHAFAAHYTEVALHVDCLPQGEESAADLVIRRNGERDAQLVSKPLLHEPRVLYAAPSYLAESGMPHATDALSAHDGLLDASLEARGGWALAQAGEVRFCRVRERLSSTSPRHLADAAEAGLGITLIPASFAADGLRRGRLLAVLPSWTGEAVELSMFYAPSQRGSRKLQALISMFAEPPPVHNEESGLTR